MLKVISGKFQNFILDEFSSFLRSINFYLLEIILFDFLALRRLNWRFPGSHGRNIEHHIIINSEECQSYFLVYFSKLASSCLWKLFFPKQLF